MLYTQSTLQSYGDLSSTTTNFIMYPGFMKIIITLQILYFIDHFTVFIIIIIIIIIISSSSSSIYAYS